MNVMWKTIAKIVNVPTYQQIGRMEFYKASIENKEGIFDCSFGKKLFQDYSQEKEVCFLKCRKNQWGFSCKKIEFLDNNEELTAIESVTGDTVT